jgi:hypothetical protein
MPQRDPQIGSVAIGEDGAINAALLATFIFFLEGMKN